MVGQTPKAVKFVRLPTVRLNFSLDWSLDEETLAFLDQMAKRGVLEGEWKI